MIEWLCNWENVFKKQTFPDKRREGKLPSSRRIPAPKNIPSSYVLFMCLSMKWNIPSHRQEKKAITLLYAADYLRENKKDVIWEQEKTN